MNDSRNTGTLLNITVVLDSSLFVLHFSLNEPWANTGAGICKSAEAKPRVRIVRLMFIIALFCC